VTIKADITCSLTLWQLLIDAVRSNRDNDLSGWAADGYFEIKQSNITSIQVLDSILSVRRMGCKDCYYNAIARKKIKPIATLSRIAILIR
jgi:hypothetical protein